MARVSLDKNPIGEAWMEETGAGSRKFEKIALYEHSGFGIDADGVLWLNNHVSERAPFGLVNAWFRLCALLPTKGSKTSTRHIAPISEWQLRVCSAGVFVSLGGDFIYVTRQALSAHSFLRVVPKKLQLHDHFTIITASAFVGESDGKRLLFFLVFSKLFFHFDFRITNKIPSIFAADHIYVCQPTSEIFAYSVLRRNFASLPPFNEEIGAIVALSATRESLFVLSDSGMIFRMRSPASITMAANRSNHLWDGVTIGGINRNYSIQ